MATVSIDELFEIQRNILEGIKHQKEALHALQNNQQTIIEKWHDFLGILLPIQMESIQPYGFSTDQLGLSDFNEQLVEAQQSNEELNAINQEKWQFIFQEGFGLKEVPALSSEEARTLVENIADAMMSEDFLTQVKESIASMEEDSLLARRQKLLTLLLPLHQTVIEKQGYTGDMGYVQAQKGLIEHYSDPVIIELSNKAQATVFEACGLF